MAWWAAVHALAAASLAVLRPGALAALALGAALLLHFLLRYPRRGPLVVYGGTGAWALPEHGLYGLGLGSGTRYGRAWARLVLADPTGRKAAVLLLADQLEPGEWRALQVILRECDTMSRGVEGRRLRARSGP